MKTPLLFPMSENEAMAAGLAKHLGAGTGKIELRHFPDGETYLRYASDISGRDIVLVCTLNEPDAKLIPLLFAAKTARDLGARSAGLVAPYLAYMRQDKQFDKGEAVTSRYLAQLLSQAFDWLITVDPHLHRYSSLADIFGIPALSVHAAPLLSAWIKANVANGVLIGPDRESEQWVSAVASAAGLPFTVLEKTRRGDREVEVRVRDKTSFADRVPILVDDIISTGRTMAKVIEQVRAGGAEPPVCLAVHGLFAVGSEALLSAAGARVVTTNTVAHPTNAIDISPSLAECIKQVLAGSIQTAR